jgi:outer membrane protein OmpA-like peptidoglycan-associated protein
MLKPSIGRTIAVLTAAVVFAGCTTINPYTREDQTSKVVKGAAIGAASGAAIGILIGDHGKDRRRNAAIGAGVGALAGGSVGYYMDVQEAKLRQKLEGTGVSVSRSGENIVLNMPSNVTFGVDSSDLRPEFFDVLASVGLVLKEYDQTLVDVAGHTDSTGSDSHNQSLSERRAVSVSQYLVTQGVADFRLKAIGFGESRPVGSNATDAGRQTNRRVEVQIVPITG